MRSLPVFRGMFFSAIFAALFCVPHFSHAATLFLSPTQIEVRQGETVTVSVRVNTEGKAVNAVSLRLTFPKSNLSVTSISKSGSILNFWVQEPTYSNSLGTVSFEGLAVNPGFTGAAGKVASVTFKAQKTGIATLTLTQAAILANDGAGTNILSRTTGGQITVVAPLIIPVTPVVVQPQEVPSVTPPVIEEQTEMEDFLTITSTPKNIKKGSHFFIRGTTNITSPVNIYIQKIDEPVQFSSFIHYFAPSTDTYDISLPATLGEGTFQADVSDLSPGEYSVFAKSTKDVVSNIVVLSVGGKLSGLQSFFARSWFVLLLVLLGMCFIIYAIVWRRKEEKHHSVLPKRKIVRESSPEEDMHDYLVEKMESGGALSLEERLFLRHFTNDH